jgi:hypothetical protein
MLALPGASPADGGKIVNVCLQNATTGSPAGCAADADSVLPAGETAHVQLTLANAAEHGQTLGSVNLDAPEGLAIVPGTVSPLPADSSATSSELQLRNLALDGGQSLVVSFDVTTGCTGSGLDWTVAAKQANDFSGEGNDFDLGTTSGLTSDIEDGGCAHIAFANQPDRTAVGGTITDAPFSSGGPIEVGLYDSSDQLLTTCSEDCSVTVAAAPADGTFGGTVTRDLTYDATAGGMVAKFDDLSIGGLGAAALPETFTLDATGHGTQATSSAFELDLAGVSCAGKSSCDSGSVQVGNSVISGDTQSGNFVYLGLDRLQFSSLPAGCQTLGAGIGTPMVVLEQRTSASGELSVTYGVAKALITKRFGNNKGQQFIPICIGAQRIALDSSSGKTVSVPCDQPYAGHAQTPWIGKKLDASGNFNQTANAPAVCDPASGYFFGIVGSFQDYTNSKKSLIIDPSWNPTVTSWTTDAVYRYFTIRFPSASGPVGGAFDAVPWDGWVFG